MRLSAQWLLFFLYAAPAWGAYRVYEIKVMHYDRTGKLERRETVQTNLDPYQYAAFLGGDGRMKIQLLDTWYCPGDTSRRGYCRKPKKPERMPASMEHDKRAPLPFNRQPVIP